MVRTIARVTAVGGLVLALTHAAAAAQAPPTARPARPARSEPVGGTLGPGEIVRMLDAYAVVQAQDTLELSDAQYGPFVTRLKTLQETRRRNQQARNQMLQALRKLVGPQSAGSLDEHAVREGLKALRDHDERAALEIQRASDAVDEVIDVRQQARFRLFEETLERRKLDLLMRARQGARRGAGVPK